MSPLDLTKTSIQVYVDASTTGEQIMSLVSKTIGTILRERAEKTPDCPGIGYRDYLYSWKEMDERCV